MLFLFSEIKKIWEELQHQYENFEIHSFFICSHDNSEQSRFLFIYCVNSKHIIIFIELVQSNNWNKFYNIIFHLNITKREASSSVISWINYLTNKTKQKCVSMYVACKRVHFVLIIYNVDLQTKQTHKYFILIHLMIITTTKKKSSLFIARSISQHTWNFFFIMCGVIESWNKLK